MLLDVIQQQRWTWQSSRQQHQAYRNQHVWASYGMVQLIQQVVLKHGLEQMLLAVIQQ